MLLILLNYFDKEEIFLWNSRDHICANFLWTAQIKKLSLGNKELLHNSRSEPPSHLLSYNNIH